METLFNTQVWDGKISQLSTSNMNWNELKKYFKNDEEITMELAMNTNTKKISDKDYLYKIVKIIHNDSAVIVFWKDKTKTVVKLKDDDYDDIYAAVAQALAKKVYGCNSAFHKMVDKVTEDHTTPMESVKASTVDDFKKFFDGVWNLSHPKETDRHSGDED